MMRVTIFLAALLSVAAFAPSAKLMKKSVINMAVEDLVGSAAKGEGGFFDPLKLSAGKDDATLNWYRASELKHGRVCMLAALGLWTQALDTGFIPNPVFHDKNGWTALKTISQQSPGAILQIVIAIAAVEVLTASLEKKGGAPGDYSWDPLNIKPKTQELFEDMQVKELKNGRLAMIGVAGMSVQSYITGQDVFEQLASGNVSPF